MGSVSRMVPFHLGSGNIAQPPSVFMMPSNMSNVVPDSPYLHSSSYPTSLPFRGSSALMYHEIERLKTFAEWPLPYMNPRDMSKAGFYYTKRMDIVRCPFCDVEVMNWEEGDDPLDDHRKWNSSCRFINQVPCGNVPIPPDAPPLDLSTLVSPTTNTGYDTCGTVDIRGVDFMNRLKTVDCPSSNTICKWKPPSFPQFASCEDRMNSFSSWPVSLKIKPNVLSEAGFYYTGKGDQTICFYCGGGLKDWEDSDDPWKEHAKWFSACTYVLLNKGQKFVDEATASILSRDKQEGTSKNVDTNEKSNNSTRDGEGCSNQSDETKTLKKSPEEPGSNERLACKVCYSRDLEVMFLPCGHVIACIECSMKLTTCGTCREPIKQVIRAFLS